MLHWDNFKLANSHVARITSIRLLIFLLLSFFSALKQKSGRPKLPNQGLFTSSGKGLSIPWIQVVPRTAPKSSSDGQTGWQTEKDQKSRNHIELSSKIDSTYTEIDYFIKYN